MSLYTTDRVHQISLACCGTCDYIDNAYIGAQVMTECSHVVTTLGLCHNIIIAESCSGRRDDVFFVGTHRQSLTVTHFNCMSVITILCI